MVFRVFDRRLRMPLVLAFTLVALFIWLAENIATWAGAWFYPDQLDGWQPVSPTKLAAWLRPRAPERFPATRADREPADQAR